MISSMQIDKSIYAKNWKRFLLWGVTLIILGLLAISTAMMTTFISVVFLGVLITIAGAIILVDTWSFWRVKKSGFALHLLMGVVYLAGGLMLMDNPLAGSISLTFLLGVLYITLGAFRSIYALTHRYMPRWGLSLLNGCVSFLLGIMILSSWPESSLYIIGLFVGIDLLVCGWVYVMSALAAHQIAK
jgi:uncharacterized membrane protein HdeD (DUF308 family)